MSDVRNDTTLYGNALRMLYILDAAGAPVGGKPPVPTAIKVIDSQKRLSALHFWMRNPDHLAAALLLKVEMGDHNLLDIVKQILDDREPELRRVPMQRYLRGAWEPVDTSMAVLVANGLAYYERVKANPDEKTLKHVYYLLRAGQDLAARMATDEPELDWYRQRAELVTTIAPEATGVASRTCSTSFPNTHAPKWAPRSVRLRAGFDANTRVSPRSTARDLNHRVRPARR